MSGSASWEGWGSSWSDLSGEPAWSDDPADINYETVNAQVAGEMFVNMLVDLKFKGVLSSKQTCVLAWWAAKAGAVGPAKDLGVRPDQQ